MNAEKFTKSDSIFEEKESLTKEDLLKSLEFYQQNYTGDVIQNAAWFAVGAAILAAIRKNYVTDPEVIAKGQEFVDFVNNNDWTNKGVPKEKCEELTKMFKETAELYSRELSES